MLPYVLEKRLKTQQLEKAQDVPISTPTEPIGPSRSSSSSLQKKKKIKISKNHASLSKLGAIGHTLSILKKKKKKKEIIFSSNIKVFKIHASICKLGAFSYISFIFKKRDHHNHLLKKNSKFPKIMHPFLNWGHSVMPYPF